MAGEGMFVVLEFNQASHQPEGQFIEVYRDLDEARGMAVEMERENRDRTRRETYRVFELVEVDD